MPVRPRRFRRAIKWGGLSLVIAMGSSWILTRWFAAGVVIAHRAFVCQAVLIGGSIWIEYFGGPGNPPPKLEVAWMGGRLNHRELDQNVFWLPTAIWTSKPLGGLMGREFAEVFIPLWIPALLLAVPTTYLILRDRRKPANSCPHCSYLLTGLAPNTPCPECGKGAAP